MQKYNIVAYFFICVNITLHITRSYVLWTEYVLARAEQAEEVSVA
jgi:hypothetical protein